MLNIKALREELQELGDRGEAILAVAKGEDRELNADENKEILAIYGEGDDLVAADEPEIEGAARGTATVNAAALAWSSARSCGFRPAAAIVTIDDEVWSRV